MHYELGVKNEKLHLLHCSDNLSPISQKLKINNYYVYNIHKNY